MRELKPFSLINDGLKVFADWQKRGAELDLTYEIRGALADLEIPESSASPKFKNELWKQTCFEIFLFEDKASSYLEWNFSPSLDWAQYRFKDYRIKEKDGRDTPKNFKTKRTDKRFCLSVSIPTPTERIGISACAILKDLHGNYSYWALRHSDPQKPDFHLKKSALAFE